MCFDYKYAYNSIQQSLLSVAKARKDFFTLEVLLYIDVTSSVRALVNGSQILVTQSLWHGCVLSPTLFSVFFKMMFQSLVEVFLALEIKTGMLEHPFICMICHQDMEDEYTSVPCVNAECQFLLNL